MFCFDQILLLVFDIIVDSAEFKPRLDVEIEEAVTAFFEIDGKLQYREVVVNSLSTLPGFDKSAKSLKRPMELGSHVMQYEPVSVADRLEKADILTNNAIIDALQGEQGDVIRAMSYAEFKQFRKDAHSVFHRGLSG